MVKHFNHNLNLLRKGWGLSQTEMAAKFGVSQSAYGRWEDNAEPNLETLLALSEYFKVPFGDFITKKLEPQDVPPKHGGRSYPPQPVLPPDVMEDASHEEVAELKAMMSKLQFTVEAVVKQSNDLPAIRAELERLKAELSALRAVKKGGG